MIAVDSNVLARHVLNDDFEQAKAAARLLAGRGPIDVLRPIWLEYEEGMDFGDALHLAISAGSDRFASFDKAITKMAARIGATPRVTQP